MVANNVMERVRAAIFRRELVALPPEAVDAQATLGQRAADRLAAVGGSWGFLGGFGLFLAVWILANFALPKADRFDPYPFIFLNLILSTLAAFQAPLILMSQNRQAQKDRLAAQHDYEVNLRAEMEIIALHQKLDRLSAEHAALRSTLAEQASGRYARQDDPDATATGLAET